MLIRLLLLLTFCTPAYAWTAVKVSPEFSSVPDGVLVHVGDDTYVKASGSPCYRLSTGSETFQAFNAIDPVSTGRTLSYTTDSLGGEGFPTTFSALVTYEDTFRIASGGDVYLKYKPGAALNLVTLSELAFVGTETVIPVPVAITVRR